MIDEEIRLSLSKIWAKMRKDYSDALRAHQIHVGQDHALCQLWMEDGVTQSQLCERMGCEPPTLTNMLKKLEEYGLVNRKQDASDARISRVFLTEQGRALEQPVLEIWRSHQDKLLNGINTEERLLLRRLLQQMDRNLNE
ncbi:MarR family winged helix-turn-helix transcriptional regulator [Paenibacillus eucommiae]|uniref:DNA-binding MarR family transcriptional regulator n=1 Tax=Paenibacillus eucommiae TaxID=1355755 RepID=A0ABS4J8Z9_9BACL|nr:MarR family transcriptional regulator [Paenibacillus eucommiae]MBP1996323.1 DNA-binding MarR family transcriptional regulator [Paenibacillus eucommiae]